MAYQYGCKTQRTSERTGELSWYTVAGFDIYVTWVILAVLVAILITYINIRGIKTAAILQTVLTFTIAGVGIILVFASAINGSPNNLDGQLLLGMAIFMAGFMVLVYIFPWFGCNLVKQEWIIIGGWGTLGIIFSAICKMVYKDKYGVML